MLIVYAEAFERDADPADFSLKAVIAHERGHQLLARHPNLAARTTEISLETEEILASLIGAQLCSASTDRNSLIAKATIELVAVGEPPENAIQRIAQLIELLENVL